MHYDITPYPDINTVLSDLMQHIKHILKDNFFGMYLYGSLAIGDFDPKTSDIDFIVITHAAVSEQEFVALRELHRQFSLSGSTWSKKIEAAYIPKIVFGSFKNSHAQETYPQLEHGRDLTRDPIEIGWAFQLHTLREYGLTLEGPNPRDFIVPINIADMQHAAHLIIKWIILIEKALTKTNHDLMVADHELNETVKFIEYSECLS